MSQKEYKTQNIIKGGLTLQQCVGFAYSYNIACENLDSAEGFSDYCIEYDETLKKEIDKIRNYFSHYHSKPLQEPKNLWKKIKEKYSEKLLKLNLTQDNEEDNGEKIKEILNSKLCEKDDTVNVHVALFILAPFVSKRIISEVLSQVCSQDSKVFKKILNALAKRERLAGKLDSRLIVCLSPEKKKAKESERISALNLNRVNLVSSISNYYTTFQTSKGTTKEELKLFRSDLDKNLHIARLVDFLRLHEAKDKDEAEDKDKIKIAYYDKEKVREYLLNKDMEEKRKFTYCKLENHDCLKYFNLNQAIPMIPDYSMPQYALFIKQSCIFVEINGQKQKFSLHHLQTIAFLILQDKKNIWKKVIDCSKKAFDSLTNKSEHEKTKYKHEEKVDKQKVHNYLEHVKSELGKSHLKTKQDKVTFCLKWLNRFSSNKLSESEYREIASKLGYKKFDSNMCKSLLNDPPLDFTKLSAVTRGEVTAKLNEIYDLSQKLHCNSLEDFVKKIKDLVKKIIKKVQANTSEKNQENFAKIIGIRNIYQNQNTYLLKFKDVKDTEMWAISRSFFTQNLLETKLETKLEKNKKFHRNSKEKCSHILLISLAIYILSTINVQKQAKDKGAKTSSDSLWCSFKKSIEFKTLDNIMERYLKDEYDKSIKDDLEKYPDKIKTFFQDRSVFNTLIPLKFYEEDEFNKDLYAVNVRINNLFRLSTKLNKQQTKNRNDYTYYINKLISLYVNKEPKNRAEKANPDYPVLEYDPVIKQTLETVEKERRSLMEAILKWESLQKLTNESEKEKKGYVKLEFLLKETGVSNSLSSEIQDIRDKAFHAWLGKIKFSKVPDPIKAEYNKISKEIEDKKRKYWKKIEK